MNKTEVKNPDHKKDFEKLDTVFTNDKDIIRGFHTVKLDHFIRAGKMLVNTDVGYEYFKTRFALSFNGVLKKPQKNRVVSQAQECVRLSIIDQGVKLRKNIAAQKTEALDTLDQRRKDAVARLTPLDEPADLTIKGLTERNRKEDAIDEQYTKKRQQLLGNFRLLETNVENAVNVALGTSNQVTQVVNWIAWYEDCFDNRYNTNSDDVTGD